jgi:inosine/xanthosine triphosphate pyrophosphatase family protein
MITFLTGNTNKFREAKAIIGHNIQQLDIDLPEIQSLDPLEIIQHKIQTAIESRAVS